MAFPGTQGECGLALPVAGPRPHRRTGGVEEIFPGWPGPGDHAVAPAEERRVYEPEMSKSANILVDLVQGILQEVDLRRGQVLSDSLPQVLGQGQEALLKLLAFFGEVDAIFPAVPGIGLAKDEAFLLQGIDHPGDVGLVF